MSVEIKRTQAELEAETTRLGLTVILGKKKIRSEDYVRALEDYFIKLKYGSEIPFPLHYMTKVLDTPMLCYRYTEMKPMEQENIWDSDDWVLDEKIDGARMIMFVSKDILGNLDFYSRSRSVVDYLPTSYFDTIAINPQIDFSQITDDFILDMEAESEVARIDTGTTVTETKLNAIVAMMNTEGSHSREIQRAHNYPIGFKVFTCIGWNGESLIEKSEEDRLIYRDKAVAQLRRAGFQVSIPRMARGTDKRHFFNEIVNEGGEGVVAKNLHTPYIITGSRSRTAWVKIKRSMFATGQLSGLSDTITGFVTGYQLGEKGKAWEHLVGALEFSVYLEKQDGSVIPHHFATVAGYGTLEFRNSITITGQDGKPTLDPSIYGRCADLDGQDIAPRALRLTHASNKGWRPDLSPEDCRISETFLLSQIL